MKWQVLAPDKERVILCEGYIRHELKHGSYIKYEPLVHLYPQYFLPVLDVEDLPKEQEYNLRRFDAENPEDEDFSFLDEQGTEEDEPEFPSVVAVTQSTQKKIYRKK